MTVTYESKPWFEHYDEGVPKVAPEANHTIHHFLETAATKYPERIALTFKGGNVSYAELNRKADAIAARLTAEGLQKGDRVAVYMPNIPQFVIIFFGVLKAGGVAVAINPLYTERELSHQIADCGAKTVFVMSRYYPLLKKVQKSGVTDVERIVVTSVKDYLPSHLGFLYGLLKEKKAGDRVTIVDNDPSLEAYVASGMQDPKPTVEVTADDMAILQYSGGTTGISKGAIGTHRNLVSNVLLGLAWDPKRTVEKSEAVLVSLPLFHIYGLAVAMLAGIAAADRLILIVNPRDMKDVLDSINKYAPANFPGVPAMYNAINNNADVIAGKYNLSSIRACLSGSAPLLAETKERFEALSGAKLIEGFGLSETLVVTHANPIYGLNKSGSIGLPWPGVDVRIVDVDDGERVLPVGEPGELVIKSPSNMAGYWNMPEETANTLRDGWVFTGDIARMDDDGYFYIEDRKKDMILASGFNVYPREIEEVLATHPDVLEVAVAGIPDPKRGQTVKAWIVLKPDATVGEDELVEWSKTQLASYKYPRVLEFRKELPRTTVGKVLKRVLVEEHARGQAGD